MERPTKAKDFPLYPHKSGKWARKVGGKTRYFGSWKDPDGALKEYQSLVADLERERLAAQAPDGLPLHEACNRFLAVKEQARDKGELAQSSFSDYVRTCVALSRHFGRTTPVEALDPSHFSTYRHKLGEKLSPISLGNEITRVRVLFKWLWDNRLIEAPFHFGSDFKRPSKKTLRRHKRERGPMIFSREQIHALLKESGAHMRAMILLGVNCGFGNMDCAKLELKVVDLEKGWIRFPRPKTEVERACPLWPETRAALRRSLRLRYEPGPEAVKRFFVTAEGKPWEASAKPITKRFRQVREWAGIKRGGFYWLRHVMATIGGGAKDQPAVSQIMGHADGSMTAHYQEEIAPERLMAVTTYVRQWLWG
jgi:integrase